MVPFGLTNAPAVAVRIGNRLLYDFIDSFIIIFMDDILVYSKTAAEHQDHLEQILQRMREYDFYLHPGKCSFFLDSVVYLGIKIDAEGISIPDSGKQAILDWPVPEPNAMPLKRGKKNPDGKTSLRTFLGFVGWYRKFIYKFSERAAPISELLKDEQGFRWGEAQ